MTKREEKEKRTEAVNVQQQTLDLLGEHSDALSIFDSLPEAKGEAADWEECMSGPEAPFSSCVEEIDNTKLVEQSENGSNFLRVLMGFVPFAKRKKA